MDVCVVLYKCDSSRIEPGLREHDRLLVRDNTNDNIGFAAGANAAARLGADPLLLFVNLDGDLTRDCLDKLERAMADSTVVGCEPDLGVWNREPMENGDLEWLSGSCMLVRRDAFEKVDGFDETFFMYSEDCDLSYKLAKLGRLIRVDDAVFNHSLNKERSFRQNFWALRNGLVVRRRHGRPEGCEQMLRDASFNLRRGEIKLAMAKITAVAAFLLYARRWA